jgi:hypothetical protein
VAPRRDAAPARSWRCDGRRRASSPQAHTYHWRRCRTS